MILFFYGEDTYSSRAKLNLMKQKFIEKNGDINLAYFDGASLDNLAGLKMTIETMPFLGDKRMVIVTNLLSQNKQTELQAEMAAYLAKVPENVFVVFYEESSEFDKRKALYKKLAQPKMSQEFKPLQGYVLNKWITQKVAEKGGEITAEAVDELAAAVGGNLWQMENEISKLVLYKRDTQAAITGDDIKKFVRAAITSNIFKMIDYLGQKNTKKACQELAFLKESGENEVYILTMMVYQFRNLIQARDILNQGGNSYTLTQRAKLHPFVAKKSIAQAENFSLEELKKIYQMLLAIDLGIKTGKLEPGLALDRFVVEVGANKTS